MRWSHMTAMLLIRSSYYYGVSQWSEDYLLEKSSLTRGTLTFYKQRLHLLIIDMFTLIAVEVLVPLRLFVCRKMS